MTQPLWKFTIMLQHQCCILYKIYNYAYCIFAPNSQNQCTKSFENSLQLIQLKISFRYNSIIFTIFILYNTEGTGALMKNFTTPLTDCRKHGAKVWLIKIPALPNPLKYLLFSTITSTACQQAKANMPHATLPYKIYFIFCQQLFQTLQFIQQFFCC